MTASSALRATLLMWLLSWAQVAQAGRCDPGTECLFAVFPHTGAQQLQDTYSAIAEDLSLVMDTRVRLVSSSGMERFQNQLEAGRWDIALTGPGQYIYFAEPAGYLPLATPERLITYRIVTLRRTQIRALEQLRRHRLGVMWPNTGTWLMTMALLEQAKIDPRQDLHTRAFASQRACIHALLIGLVDACGLATPIFRVLAQEKPGDYLTLAESIPQAGGVYLAHPDLSADKRQAVTDYLLGRPGMRRARPEYWDYYRRIARRLGEPPR